MALNIEIQGLSKALDQIQQYKRQKTEAISNELKQFAFDTVDDAQNNLTSQGVNDLGALRSSIRVGTVTKTDAEVRVDADYAAYVEFGTGGLVEIPKGLENYAAQFKGRGIKEVNLPARPYLFPAVTKNAKAIVENIKKVLK